MKKKPKENNQFTILAVISLLAYHNQCSILKIRCSNHNLLSYILSFYTQLFCGSCIATGYSLSRQPSPISFLLHFFFDCNMTPYLHCITWLGLSLSHLVYQEMFFFFLNFFLGPLFFIVALSAQLVVVMVVGGNIKAVLCTLSR